MRVDAGRPDIGLVKFPQFTGGFIPKRCVVERSFAWLEKTRRLWQNCERNLNTSLQFIWRFWLCCFGDHRRALSGFVQVGENDLALLIKDPQQKLADIDVPDASGAALKNGGHVTTKDVVILSFDQKLPDNVELKLYLATPGALVRVPIALKDVVLP